MQRITGMTWKRELPVLGSTRNWLYAFLAASISLSLPVFAAAQQTTEAPKASASERDGSHDFDPLLGKWKYHLKRRLNPLTGSDKWIELVGTGECHKIWDGAEIDQITVDGAGTHIEGLTLRTYNPERHEWRLHWANRRNGLLDVPQVGKFKDGHGEFYAQDFVNGKTIFVKFDWSGMNTNSPHFEQSFSEDGGRTWEVNWITDQVKVKE